ncbi:putative vacuolar protein sorting-associated protein 13D [Camellia lanceoleosa]|uniref:Vacuolar protein sorting-associated protein 13D n=1 Tax=Camellia lanceoleosa TaxID=1840588 RepID=A0ACC0GPK2_9ERIC|nr:putative vacuolar protein sorting-associated protein 13D [Camellia lanceoleosa]
MKSHLQLHTPARKTTLFSQVPIANIPAGIAKLEVEVTNLAAKAGKGEVVGASSFSVGHGANTLKKVSSVRMLHQPPDGQHIVSYPLKTKGWPNCDDINSGACLLVSTSYFERKAIAKFQSSVQIGNDVNRDVGFWAGLGPKGEWESFRSFLPLTVITKTLNNDFVVVKVVMRNGKKHAIFRGLASVANDSGVKLDVSVCPISMINSHDLSEAGKKKVMGQSITSMNDVVGTISPGSSVVLPWRSMSKDFDHCLQVRPCFDHPQPPYSWGYAVAVGSGYAYGKDQPSMDQVLQTKLNALVYDWKISINSPLKLENRLPCPAEFTVWEKLKEGNSVERQYGIIPSRGSVHIYSADVRKPIYLSLFVQGGWVLEKDPVVVLDLTSSNHALSFWMVYQQRKTLRVSIERDMGGTAVAPKTIRFFIPYWISNESSLSLGYRVVEIEPLESVDAESLLPSKSFKSAKTALRSPINLMDRRPVGLRKNVQVLEAIEDTSPTPSMLSPQDYVGRGGVMLFSTRNDAYLSPRVGIAVAIRNSEFYSPGISLLELEKKQRAVVKAFNSDGSYHKLSAMLQMTSDRTKPHTLFLNKVGRCLSLQRCDTQMLEWIHPTDPPRHFGWQPSTKLELLKTEGLMCVSLKNETKSEQIHLRVEVRSGTKIENRSLFLPVSFQQVDGTSDSWRSLLPNSAASFLWEDLGRRRLLELLVDGTDPLKSQTYNIDEISDHQPIHVAGGPSKALHVSILKEEKINVIKLSDWMPENDAIVNQNVPSSLSQLSGNDFQHRQLNTSNCEFHVIIELAKLGLSIIDHTPEEILYMSVQNLLLSYSTGLDSGISRLKVRMRGIPVDNQLPLTPMPVLFRPQRVVEETDYILKFSMTQQSNGSLDLCVYLYIGFQGLENSAFLINIHEPIIWRLHGMVQHVNLNRLYDSQSNAVSFDPIIQICVLNISEVCFKVSMAMSPTQRPVGVLGFWSSLMTALGSTENMPVRINQRFQENVCMRQTVLISNAILNIKKDLLGQPLQLLSGVDIWYRSSCSLDLWYRSLPSIASKLKWFLCFCHFSKLPTLLLR